MATRRTAFYSIVNGNIVFNDWCVVATNLGTMVEPLPANRFNPDMQAYDPSDEVSAINEMKEVSLDALQGGPPFTDPEGTPLHGGALNPRTGF